MTFDYKNPDYASVIIERMGKLKWIRSHPEHLEALKGYYAENPDDFINDWGVTYDPRNVDVGLPAYIPFVLFDKQREWVRWVMERWRSRTPGLCEKSREMGVSWLATSLACTLCLLRPGVSIGFGSRKSEYVDKSDEPKCLFWKARAFMEHLPIEFTGGWQASRHAPHMRINFPDTGSFIGGEGGDDIGRGDRRSIYFVDEAEHLERPEKVEAALSQTTNCRIDMSSVNGTANPFARKMREGKISSFIFDWHDDPRKDQAWYDKQCSELDPVVVAQEIDRDRSASMHGILIPGLWVRASIDALRKLGIAPTGSIELALDVADEGRDKNAMCGGHGVEVSVAEEWSGKGSDTFHTVERAFEICDQYKAQAFRYDADGMGALVRGDARVINERRQVARARALRAVEFRGSGEVFDPDGLVEGTIGISGDRGRTNKDYFANRKAQACWALRKRFQRTYRWVVEDIPCAPDDLISLNPKMPNLQKLVAECSQPTYSQNGVGKMLINKKPDGMPSPNLFDGVMMRFAKIEAAPMAITQDMIAQVIAAGRRRR